MNESNSQSSANVNHETQVKMGIIGARHGRVPTAHGTSRMGNESMEAPHLMTEYAEFLESDLSKPQSLLDIPILARDGNATELARTSSGGLAYFRVAQGSSRLRLTDGEGNESRRPDDTSKARTSFGAPTPRARSLVTGGAGFLGSHLCDRLLEEGHEVICLDNLITGALRNIEHLKTHRRFTFARQDVTSALDLPFLLGRTAEWKGSDVLLINCLDHIFHLASPASPKHYALHPLPTLRVGSLGTWNVLDLARATGASFLLASTSEVYGDPEVSPQPESYWGRVNSVGPRSVYDEAKRYSEALTIAYGRQHGVQIHIARIFNTYGERMREDDGRALPNFMMQAMSGEPLTVYGDGSQTRSLCYVSDMVEGLLRLMFSDETGPVNIGNPDELSMRTLAEKIIEITESKSSITFEALPQDDPTRRCPDISRATSSLGWQPRVTLREGIKKVLPYFRSKVRTAALTSRASN